MQHGAAEAAPARVWPPKDADNPQLREAMAALQQAQLNLAPMFWRPPTGWSPICS